MRRKHTITVVAIVHLILLLVSVNVGHTCIGEIIVIGTSDAPKNRLMAEIIMQLVTERTGTKAKIVYYDKDAEVTEDLVTENEESQIDILLTNSLAGQWNLDFIRMEEKIKEYPAFSIIEYTTISWVLPDMTWVNNDFSCYPLMRTDLLPDFPALPRLLNKIISRLDAKEFSNLVDKVQRGNKARNVAREVLDEKGLI